MTRFTLLVLLATASLASLRAQAVPPYQDDFPAEEFVQRRARVMDAIGTEAIAVVQGAPGVDGFKVFRQSNEFYYLTGLETPHAYLVLDGRTRRATLYGARFEGYNPIASGGTNAWMGHPGAIWGQPFREGQVFTVDPMMWIPDEKLYVRMEDTILVTKAGIENFTAFLASTPGEIEAVMKQEGVLSRVPRLP